ncbi:MAG TPA: hypothetical protein VM578_09320 [Candidatus Saccharimonadales bacterium]|nr:hypothetical protein [Candidatus Saccharimonadales bacterium]
MNPAAENLENAQPSNYATAIQCNQSTGVKVGPEAFVRGLPLDPEQH